MVLTLGGRSCRCDNEECVVDDPPERYLLQFWPAPAAPDRIVRQTSAVAGN